MTVSGTNDRDKNQKSKMANGRHLENRKIATSGDDTKWVSQAHWPSAILEFYH